MLTAKYFKVVNIIFQNDLDIIGREHRDIVVAYIHRVVWEIPFF
jgi:hypothetical protein